eukprot:GEMP01009064.1.p1 GENE.GEMP01009064.1~~GEMP01009064.1.p1  ORF type:complete len:843 (+),score=244.17 GEMP01009064.1:195-2531(+)
MFQVLGVTKSGGKYYWRDHAHRCFEVQNRRRVLVPYEMAAAAMQRSGFQPVMLDVEPEWTLPEQDAMLFPCVAVVLGHINHGKTTLLDTIRGTQVALGEPGGITQNVRAFTLGRAPQLSPAHQAALDKYAGGMKDKAASLYLDKVTSPLRTHIALKKYPVTTWIDTPGHEAFQNMRGRSTACADVAVVLVSCEEGADVQTEEVLLHAEAWDVPVLFALNKIDLPYTNVDLVRQELVRQCQLLHEAGRLARDHSAAALRAVPISALHGTNVDALVEQVVHLPRQWRAPLEMSASPKGAFAKYKHLKRRTDYLTGLEVQPIAILVVLEVEKTADRGTMLTCVVQYGMLSVGHYFVAGSSFGRVTNIYEGDDEVNVKPLQTCLPKTAVRVTGVRYKYGGDVAPDDLLIAYPRERAWRLSEHRRRIEELNEAQASGPLIDVPWVLDNSKRTEADFDREEIMHPEKHHPLAYRSAVDEYGTEAGTAKVFTTTSHAAFHNKTTSNNNGKPLPKPSIYVCSDDEVEEEDEGVVEHAKQQGGRKSTRAKLASASRKPDAEARSDTTTDGSSSSTKHAKFVYYTDRTTWTEEADRDTQDTQTRWEKKNVKRWQDQEHQRKLAETAKKMADQHRREVLGLPPRKEPEPTEPAYDNTVPVDNSPVISVILKTKNMGTFDTIMSEFDTLGEKYGMRIPIVHGGIGPVAPRDVVHGEVEQKYGYCPIYAFQVGTHPDAVTAAEKSQIQIKEFHVFTELCADLEKRLAKVQRKIQQTQYASQLKMHPTKTGL